MKRMFLGIIAVMMLVLTGCPATHKEVIGQSGKMQMASAINERGEFNLTCYGADGQLKWQETAHNALANEGEELIQNVFFRGATAPTQFYLRLYNATPTLTSTLSTLSASEVAPGTGYTPANNGITKDATGWPSAATLVSSHFEITTKTVTITATGTVGPATYAALATTSDNTGKLIAYAALSQTRTLSSGDSLQLTYKIRFQ